MTLAILNSCVGYTIRGTTCTLFTDQYAAYGFDNTKNPELNAALTETGTNFYFRSSCGKYDYGKLKYTNGYNRMPMFNILMASTHDAHLITSVT